MSKEVCNCIKLDMHGETDCKDASCDPAMWGFVCNNECVVEMTKRLEREKEARKAAEAILEKYRHAIKPFVDICREVVSICDKQEGDAE